MDGENWCLSSPSEWETLLKVIPQSVSEVFSTEALLVVLGWMGFQALLERVLPGEVVEGVKLATGDRLKYRLNGHLAFWVTMAMVMHAWPVVECGADGVSHSIVGFTRAPLGYVYDHYVELATASIVVSFALSLYLYVTSFVPNRLLAVSPRAPLHTVTHTICLISTAQRRRTRPSCMCIRKEGTPGTWCMTFSSAAS